MLLAVARLGHFLDDDLGELRQQLADLLDA